MLYKSELGLLEPGKFVQYYIGYGIPWSAWLLEVPVLFD